MFSAAQKFSSASRAKPELGLHAGKSALKVLLGEHEYASMGSRTYYVSEAALDQDHGA